MPASVTHEIFSTGMPCGEWVNVSYCDFLFNFECGVFFSSLISLFLSSDTALLVHQVSVDDLKQMKVRRSPGGFSCSALKSKKPVCVQS